MSQPTLYFIRHGETDWNAVGRLQGQRDIPLNDRGRAQAVHCGAVVRDLLARDHRSLAQIGFVASPLSRTRETMELVRAGLGLTPGGYRTDVRLVELAFGAWEGFTYADLRKHPTAPRQLAERERDKWNFRPPDGENYAQLLVRVRGWYESLDRDTIVVSHGGVARALFVLCKMLEPAVAPAHDVDQGVVYVLAPGRLTRCA